jgi:hypothetical protein
MFRNWAGWDNTSKPWDRDRPFHRINSPVFKQEEVLQDGDKGASDEETEKNRQARADKLRANGHGYDRGCRIPSDIPIGRAESIGRSLFGRDPRNVVRTVPSWVTVEDSDEIKEVEGVLLRCYQTWTDMPLFQWHRWYDWNLFVTPAPGYGYLRGQANKPPEIAEGPDKVAGYTLPVIRDFDKELAETMECEFDCGLFGSRFCLTKINPIQSFGPMFESDWAWPLAGQYFWGTGRWIYDCSHPNSDGKDTRKGVMRLGGVGVHDTFVEGSWIIIKEDGSVMQEGEEKFIVRMRDAASLDFRDADRDFRDRVALQEVMVTRGSSITNIPWDDVVHLQDGKIGLARSELHPVKALASARWEAVSFPENNNLFVPGIQFLFFATKEGGYYEDLKLGGQDYEFIVDLPKIKEPEYNWTIGHTSEFPFNTGVLRSPQLLWKVDFDPFQKSIDRTSKALGRSFNLAKIEPKIEFVPPKEPGLVPEQVKVTIPLAGVGSGVDAYGVILSLGWLDPDRSQARRVKKVKVSNFKIKVGAERHDTFLLTGPTAEWQVRVGVNGRWMQVRQEGITAHDVIDLPRRAGINANPVEFHLADDDFVCVAAHGEETDAVHDTYKDRTDADRTLTLGRSGPMDYMRDCVKGNLVKARQVVTAIEDDQMFTGAVESDPLGRLDPFHGEANPKNPVNNPFPVRGFVGKKDMSLDAPLVKEVGHAAELAENVNIGPDFTLTYTIEVTDQKIP